MGDLIIETNITKDLEYVIMIIEKGVGFGFYKDQAPWIVKDVEKAEKYPKRRAANTFIRNQRQYIQHKWAHKEVNNFNVSS